jgi:sulfane dehydrogenase subunit SoxC
MGESGAEDKPKRGRWQRRNLLWADEFEYFDYTGEAALQAPVLSKAFTRFRMPWRWDGGAAILQSRAWDEAGNVQPTRADFVAKRGELKAVQPAMAFPNQHFNAITSWAVDRTGEVKHVYA